MTDSQRKTWTPIVVIATKTKSRNLAPQRIKTNFCGFFSGYIVNNLRMWVMPLTLLKAQQRWVIDCSMTVLVACQKSWNGDLYSICHWLVNDSFRSVSKIFEWGPLVTVIDWSWSITDFDRVKNLGMGTFSNCYWLINDSFRLCRKSWNGDL